MKLYKELTYILCKDWEIFETPATLEQVEALYNANSNYIKLWNDLMIMKSDIKRIYKNALSPVEQIVYSVEDKFIREQLQADIDKRLKDWLRVNPEIVQNLLSKYQ